MNKKDHDYHFFLDSHYHHLDPITLNSEVVDASETAAAAAAAAVVVVGLQHLQHSLIDLTLQFERERDHHQEH